MVTINQEALAGLADAVGSLLPPLAPGLERDLLISAVRVTPTGIGGYVGLNQDPLGDINGRRVEARLLVNLRAGNSSQLTTVVNDHTISLISPDRASLLDLGIYRITVDEVGTAATGGQGQGTQERSISFSVLYEFLKRPEETGGVIQEIPINMDLGQEGPTPDGPPSAPVAPPGIVFRSDLAEDSLDLFEVVDDPSANRNRPSRWEYNAAESRIEQLSNIWGGSSRPNANKPGTYLVLRTSAGIPPIDNFDFTVRMSSEDDDAIGLVFRWQDVDNYYFFVMDSEGGYRLMGKKVAGAFALLDTSALDSTQGYEVGTIYNVRVNAVGTNLSVYLDGDLALQGEDASIGAAGRVGLMCRSNNQAFFYRIELVRA